MGSHLSMADIWSLLLNLVTLSGPTQPQSKTENPSSSWRIEEEKTMATEIPVDQSTDVTAGQGEFFDTISHLLPSLFRRAQCYCWAMERCWVHYIYNPTWLQVPPWHARVAHAHLPISTACYSHMHPRLQSQWITQSPWLCYSSMPGMCSLFCHEWHSLP